MAAGGTNNIVWSCNTERGWQYRRGVLNFHVASVQQLTDRWKSDDEHTDLIDLRLRTTKAVLTASRNFILKGPQVKSKLGIIL